MAKVTELHQTIYCLLAAQIEFGTYRYGDTLPRMEDASRWFSVSLDTVRAAYLHLKRDGYITITRKAGAVVAVRFQEAELEKNIQTFFSLRRTDVIDLCKSLGPLFSHAQWFALKNAEPECLDELERLCQKPETLPAYVLVQHVRLIYGTLNNELFMRLIWQAFMFYQAPFLSLPENMAAFEAGDGPLLDMIGLCRRKDWDGLWKTVSAYQDQLTDAINWFYTERITMEPLGEPVMFQWNAYENTSQRCYSLAMELLRNIRFYGSGQGSFLPSPAKIAEEKQVSVITVRRTLTLLNYLGAVRSVNGVGTQVLSVEESAENCDFSQPVIHKRLLDFAQSLQILALTCGQCVEDAFISMTAAGMEKWKRRLQIIRESQMYESVVFAALEMIPYFSPVQAVREIYREFLQVLIWGYPLRGLHGPRKTVNEYYLPYLDSLSDRLERRDVAGLAAEMEGLILNEFRFARERLMEMGVEGAFKLMIPDSEA